MRTLCAAILVAMLTVTLNATSRQPVWEWGALVNEPDRWWTIATLADAYCGFVIFWVWVSYKECTAAARLGWFVAIMTLGNIATSLYLLIELARLRPDEPLERLLLRSPASAAATRS